MRVAIGNLEFDTVEYEYTPGKIVLEASVNEIKELVRSSAGSYFQYSINDGPIMQAPMSLNSAYSVLIDSFIGQKLTTAITPEKYVTIKEVAIDQVDIAESWSLRAQKLIRFTFTVDEWKNL